MLKSDFTGMKVLIMGLGLNGGNVEAARYLARAGAEITVTDLRDEKTLSPSLKELSQFSIRCVLGRHEMEDFRNADMVIKNPGVRPDSPYLAAARRIETDISIFLTASPARLLAVTGSKGKSSVSAALHHALGESRSMGLLKGKARLGGNIALSPLSFLDDLEEGDDAVLELSSWQLGDLRGLSLLKPRAAIITPIMKDHLDRYGSMEAYAADKRLIYRNQDEADLTVACDDEWGRSFLGESRGRPLAYSERPLPGELPGGWIANPRGPGFARLWEIPAAGNIQGGMKNTAGYNGAGRDERGSIVEIVPDRLLVPGLHQKQNLLAAALALLDLGLPADFIRESLGRFPGIPHRMEFFHECCEIRFYDDTCATIPEAAAAAITAFEKAPVLVCGGTDKNLDFTPLALAAKNAKALILISGSGTDKLKILLDRNRIKYHGPFDSLEAAAGGAMDAAAPGDNVVLSPGCTSFGMFLNEFERGNKWKEEIKKLGSNR